MTANTWIECRYFAVRQPLGEFYVASMKQDDLLEISFADIRRVELEEAGEIETYLGIQRELSKRRVEEIADYVRTLDASFPNSIILAIESVEEPDESEEVVTGDYTRNIDIDVNRNLLRIRRGQSVAKIIDGQHRIAGLKKARAHKPDDGASEFEVIVTVFVDMDIADQALVFATINKAQTKVNKSLVYDLYEYAHSRSPQKTAHNIAVLLDQREKSPFYRKIKRLGRASDDLETITQATFVESLLRYVSRNPNRDADRLKRGKRLEPDKGRGSDRLLLRDMFRQERDVDMAMILWTYFSAVRSRWPSWDTVERGNILNRSTGFIALMRFFEDAYRAASSEEPEILEEEFRRIFSRIHLEDTDFTPDRFKPGSTGQSALLRELKAQSGLGSPNK